MNEDDDRKCAKEYTEGVHDGEWGYFRMGLPVNAVRVRQDNDRLVPLILELCPLSEKYGGDSVCCLADSHACSGIVGELHLMGQSWVVCNELQVDVLTDEEMLRAWGKAPDLDS